MKRLLFRVAGAFILIFIVIGLGTMFGPSFTYNVGKLIGLIGVFAILARMLGLRKKKR